MCISALNGNFFVRILRIAEATTHLQARRQFINFQDSIRILILKYKERTAMSKSTALIIEDSQTQGEFIGRMLAREDWNYVLCKEIRAARDLYVMKKSS